MAKLRILHIEDDPIEALLVQEMLEVAGFELEMVHASSRAEFFSAIQAGQFDVILSDNNLPGFSGEAALIVCRKECPTIPFIVLSGDSDEKEVSAKLKAGARAYIIKYDLALLVAALREMKETPS